MNALLKPNPAPITMTSLELVDSINEQRKDGEPDLTHANFLAKVPKVLGETSHSFECDLPDGYGRSRRGYRFEKREACLMAMSYSYDPPPSGPHKGERATAPTVTPSVKTTQLSN